MALGVAYGVLYLYGLFVQSVEIERLLSENLIIKFDNGNIIILKMELILNALYVVHNISVCVLYLTNSCPEMAIKHNKWIKIVMAFCSAVFGPASIYYLFADFFWCQDHLSFYFSLFEYLFVFSCFVLIAEMSRYYWDKSIVIRLDGRSNGCECDDPEGSRFPLNQSVTSE